MRELGLNSTGTRANDELAQKLFQGGEQTVSMNTEEAIHGSSLIQSPMAVVLRGQKRSSHPVHDCRTKRILVGRNMAEITNSGGSKSCSRVSALRHQVFHQLDQSFDVDRFTRQAPGARRSCRRPPGQVAPL